jgi:predicted XRE-type DNA-binding protein
MPRITKADAAKRVELIKALKCQGLNQSQIGERIGLTQPAVCSFMKKHGLISKAMGKMLTKLRPRDWGAETADPSNLSKEQLDIASRTGISPERFAWLCTCPKDGSDRKGARP